MRKTYDELQRELVESEENREKLKEHTRTLKTQLLEYKGSQKRLIVQYERIIREWQRMYKNLLENGWKIVFAKLVIYYKKLRGEKII